MKIYNSFIKSSLQKLILSDIAKSCEVQSSAFSFCTSTILLGIENYCLKKNQPVLINPSVNFGSSVIENTSLQPDINTPSIMSKFRLSSTITPKAYDLYLYPNLKTGLYKGKVIINLNVSEITNDITLHSKGLTIIKAEIDGEEASFKLDEEHQLLKLTKKSRKLVNLEEASLEIEFHGDMRKKLVGLYQSTYKDGDTLRPIATSKFEPTYARQAFPCFDEPNMKAAYTIHLWVPNEPNYIALSNYPQVGEEPYEDGKLIHFQESVSMSTYLACFIVSDFNFTQTSFQNKDTTIPFRVYATPQQLNKTKYAGEVGKKTIEYYIKYFDIPYPLPKLDMVAIPDFSSGAMEHWGLVTYRETALLYTPETHSAENQQRVLVVVAHELAHSWFGNLVTMDWWDNLWLNEGFASYIEYKGGDAAEPTFGLMEQFLVNELHPVLNLDAKISSHPIIQDVATPDQITEVFDTISYNKGASVLRMLERTVGEEKFRKGITTYLNKYKYGNAVTEQLWSEIQNVVGPSINVSEFMDSFTIQMGYPILNVTENDNEYTLTQKRFLSNPDDVKKQKPSKLGYKWTIPITYITDKGKSDVIWFDRSHENLTIKKPQNVEWLKFNYDQVGYYRVNYPEKIWKELGLIMLNLTVSDRTHLLEEAFSIANSGQLSFEVPLELTKYLVNEINYAPWKVVSAKMQGLLRLLKGSKYEDQLKQHIIEILSPAYEKLSWVVGKNDSHLTKLTRVVVLKLACEVEYDDALKDASSQLDNWFKTRVAAPDLRDIIYKYGMKTADQEKWEKMLQIFKEETDANEKVKQMRGLAAVRNPSLLTKLIILAEDETYVRKQDYHNLLLMIADNPVGLPIVWDYIRENWKTLVSRFTLNDRYLGELIPGVTSSFLTQTKLSEMEVFFRTYPEAGAGTAARNRASETVKNNIVWLSKYKKVVEAWLQNKK